MRILHVITDLAQGGAETVLFRLVEATRDSTHHRVVALHGEGYFGPKLREIGIELDALGMPRGAVTVAGIQRLRRIMVAFAPDVVQTRLYHADLVGGFAAYLSGAPPIVWAVHSTELGPMRSTARTRLIRRLCAAVSYVLPTAIVCDAEGTLALHRSLGYDRGKLLLIANGVDLSGYYSDSEVRNRMRAELGAQPDEVLIGFVARWDPLKDHATLFRALEMIAANGTRFRCVLTGRGMAEENAGLMALIGEYGLTDRVLMLGPRDDVAKVMNAIDLHVLSSYSESMPVVIIEAMACGTPCVVTDVGDCARVVGDAGWVVPPRDPAALAAGIEAALAALAAQGKEALGRAGRRRVEENFSLQRMVGAYYDLWAGLIARDRQPCAVPADPL